MSIPGLSTIKTWLLVGISFALTVVTFLWGHEKVARTNDKLKRSIKARKQVENALEVKENINSMSDDSVAGELHKFDRD